MWYIWLIAAGVFFIAEIITVGFLIFWLGIASLFAMITSFITDNLFIQTIVFVISSALLILLTKPFVDKYITNKQVPTNAFSLIAKKGVVIIPIDPIEGIGQVKVDGQIWSAKCAGESTLEVGTKIEVLKIDGVKLVVTPTKDTVQTK